MMKRIVYLQLLLLWAWMGYAQPPAPPAGKRWVLNEAFSDEFNGASLDTTKWLDHHPSWRGRPPGLFLPSQVSVADGYLQLKGGKMMRDSIITSASGEKLLFNIASGIVVSKSNDAYFGYYECRFKAAKTTMSSTFWLSTSGNTDGPNDCKDKYGLELDIQECIGREGNFDGKWFAKGMHSNGHFWYTDCQGIRHDYRSPEVRFPSDKLESADFNIYGGWWRDESSASFYYNQSDPKHMHFYDKVKTKPFDQPMTMRLASETYPAPWIALPTDEELADSTKNICYYDWVRSYYLVDIDEPSKPQNLKKGSNPEAKSILKTSSPLWTMFPDSAFVKTIEGNVPAQDSISITYMAPSDRELRIAIINRRGDLLGEQKVEVYAGYGTKNMAISNPLYSRECTFKATLHPLK
ncbi:hypothetical protein [Dyadobacter tibetensis]|uniref:hypothetical protein n=1 Tax=Dyadobacter tibetensis TaxID=1211851 RepID=UPI00047028C1|nr:hypothetical protein [Dyadobacter tibetensis]